MIAGEDVILIKPLYLILMKNNLGNVKQCKMLVKHYHIYVNGVICTNSDYPVCKDDKIEYDGQMLNAQPFVYYMLHKPKGYICANRDQNYPCVTDLIDRDDCYCVGRLDKDTTGLLLLTNDPSLSKKLLLPQNHQEKTYLVTTSSPLKQNDVYRFQQGMIIDQDVKCLPAKLDIIDDYHCYVTICEGKYHQVKKMFLSLNNQVIELKRITFSNITLDPHLKEGDYRKLNEREMKYVI